MRGREGLAYCKAEARPEACAGGPARLAQRAGPQPPFRRRFWPASLAAVRAAGLLCGRCLQACRSPETRRCCSSACWTRRVEA